MVAKAWKRWKCLLSFVKFLYFLFLLLLTLNEKRIYNIISILFTILSLLHNKRISPFLTGETEKRNKNKKFLLSLSCSKSDFKSIEKRPLPQIKRNRRSAFLVTFFFS